MTIIIENRKATVHFASDHGVPLFLGEGPNGEQLRLELDTCTSPNVVRESLARAGGWISGKSTCTSGVLQAALGEAAEAKVPKFSVPGLSVEGLVGIVDELESPSQPDLMLGTGFLDAVVTSVDYEDMTLGFESAEHWTAPVRSDREAMIVLDTGYGGTPCVRDQVTLNGAELVGSAYLDTGFNGGVLLSAPVADRVGIVARGANTEEVESGGYGGAATVLTGTLDEVMLGPFRLQNVDAYRVPDGANAPFPDSNWVNIGNAILARFAATWALRHQVVILRQL